MALWGGRFEKGVDQFTQEFGASLEADKSMAAQDIAGSRAHARMLAEQGIISAEDQAAIDAGLADIARQIEDGTFVWDVNDEDVHMAVEGALTRAIGAPGGRLHTGRSRNDQVATDIRLLAKELCDQLLSGNRALRRVLLDVAERNLDVVMPGYTHLQHAQPVLLSHHLLAYFWMFTRDHVRLVAARDAADLVIDTSRLRPRDLRSRLRRAFSELTDQQLMEVSVFSFGFKHGMPVEADLMVDVRFLPNPFYDPEMRPLTGNDRLVADFVLQNPTTEKFLDAWYRLLDVTMPGYVAEGKTSLSIAVGCTGGQHRSVAIANATAAYLERSGYHVVLSHRDLALANVRTS